MKALVVVPTYNEKENIVDFISEVQAQNPAVDILVVDDNSPDGTGEVVKNLISSNSKLFLLSRPGKQGLGRAYVAGFKWGLEKNYEVFFEMDADFSHRAVDLNKLIMSINKPETDFVVGSRYVPGGSTVNWGFFRKLISKGGSLYASFILQYPLRDWTGGFNGWKSKVLKSIGLDNIESNGYSFQIELKYRALIKNFKSQEVPIVFEERRVGQSKMSSKIVFEAMIRVWKFRWFKKQMS